MIVDLVELAAEYRGDVSKGWKPPRGFFRPVREEGETFRQFARRKTTTPAQQRENVHVMGIHRGKVQGRVDSRPASPARDQVAAQLKERASVPRGAYEPKFAKPDGGYGQFYGTGGVPASHSWKTRGVGA